VSEEAHARVVEVVGGTPAPSPAPRIPVRAAVPAPPAVTRALSPSHARELFKPVAVRPAISLPLRVLTDHTQSEVFKYVLLGDPEERRGMEIECLRHDMLRNADGTYEEVLIDARGHIDTA
jgi:hypothetical protein